MGARMSDACPSRARPAALGSDALAPCRAKAIARGAPARPREPEPEPADADAAEPEFDPDGADQEGAAEAPLDLDGHVYVVWCTDVPWDLTGVHAGGRRAWRFLVRHLGVYSYRRGHRLRRAGGVQEGIRLYEDEAVEHGAPPVAAVWRH